MKTKNEVLEFLRLHMPIAIEPKTKGNKTKFQNPFVSQHAFNVCCEHLAENLTEWINEDSQSLNQPNNNNYDPFGEEWRKELRKISNKNLFEMFKVEKPKGNKEDYITKIRSELIVRQSSNF